MRMKKTITGLVMACAITITAFNPMTVSAEGTPTTLSYNNPEDREFLDNMEAQIPAFDMDHPDNQWLDTPQQILDIIAESKYRGTNVGISEKYNTSIFLEYVPFPYVNYYINGISTFWAPEGLKFMSSQVSLFEINDIGYYGAAMENEKYYRGNYISTLVNEQGIVISNFTSGTNYIVCFAPIMYSEQGGHGVVLRMVLPVEVTSYEEAEKQGYLDNLVDFTKEQSDYFVALSNLPIEERNAQIEILRQQYLERQVFNE